MIFSLKIVRMCVRLLGLFVHSCVLKEVLKDLCIFVFFSLFFKYECVCASLFYFMCVCARRCCCVE